MGVMIPNKVARFLWLTVYIVITEVATCLSLSLAVVSAVSWAVDGVRIMSLEWFEYSRHATHGLVYEGKLTSCLSLHQFIIIDHCWLFLTELWRLPLSET